MAVGDITRDGAPRVIGNLWLLTGTVEVDQDLTAFALGGRSAVSIKLTCEDDSGVCRARINENASGTETLGTVALQSNLGIVNTFRYEYYFVM